MIEINLVSLDLRKKKKSSIIGGVKIPLEIVIGSGGGLIMLLILTHIGLLFLNITKLTQHKSLKKKWEEIAPEKANVDKVIKEMRELRVKRTAIEGITEGDKIIWAQKLNILSDSLPRGVWLSKVRLQDDVFFVEGSAISKQNDEIINVHSFAANLKDREDFLEQFHDLELGSIQRRSVSNTEIIDFLITAELIIEEEEEEADE